jgi:hypothetical protein
MPEALHIDPDGQVTAAAAPRTSTPHPPPPLLPPPPCSPLTPLTPHLPQNVGQEDLARLFRRFPGMEYCDLKKDRATGKSKGYAYVNFSTPEAAALAIEQLHGTEFPPHSGSRIKVRAAGPWLLLVHVCMYACDRQLPARVASRRQLASTELHSFCQWPSCTHCAMHPGHACTLSQQPSPSPAPPPVQVMYAEQLGPRPVVPPPLVMHSPMHPALPQPLVSAGPSPVRTPLPHGLGSAADVVAVRDSLASMSLPRLDPAAVQNGGTTPLHDLNRRMSTPAASSGGACRGVLRMPGMPGIGCTVRDVSVGLRLDAALLPVHASMQWLLRLHKLALCRGPCPVASLWKVRTRLTTHVLCCSLQSRAS